MKRLAIVSTHPIQYNAPLFKLLTERNNIKVKVFYTWGQSENSVKYDPGFKKNIEWDLPLLDGYEYEFIKNTSPEPGSHHFKGIINPTLINDIESYNPNGLLVFGWSFKSHLKLMRYFKRKVRIMFRGDSTLLDESSGFSLKKIIRRFFLTWVYQYIDMALYVGSANKAYFLKNGVKETQLIFAPHAIDNNRFIQQANVNKEKVSEKRNELGIPSSAIVFLFAGKMEPKKNPEILVDAFIQLSDPNAHLLLVGNGVLEDMLKAKVATQKDETINRIHFMSFQNQSNMPDIYCMGDVFCLPSRGPGETWGLAVNEAMACSKIILVSDKCGCAEDLVKDDKNGFIIKNNDLDDLIKKMRLIADDKNNIPAKGTASINIIKQWSYDKICIAIESALI